MASASPLHIGMIAGEASGDMLGADLMRALKKRHPQIKFTGIGGPRMTAEGFQSLFQMDRLSVMGLIDPLLRLPELLRIRRQLRLHFLEATPDLVMGIDSPDFNLGLELSLRARGITTAHYVSPSVWAWRQGRIHKIARAVDQMLTLFPFEERFYQQHGVPVCCVGHPLADQIPLGDQRAVAREALGLAAEARIVALLPGSRRGEVAQLTPIFLATAEWLYDRDNKLQFIIPAASHERARQIEALLQTLPDGFPLTLLEGQSQRAMAAADSVLMASGTTTLEAMLLKRPMVVTYRFGRWSYAILSRLVKADFIALPNLLAREALVPELLQDRVRADVLGPLLRDSLDNQAYRDALQARFAAMHATLARNASETAADSLLQLIERKQISAQVAKQTRESG